MIDASKLPTVPAASDPARAGKAAEQEVAVEAAPQFARAPDGAGYVRGQSAQSGKRAA